MFVYEVRQIKKFEHRPVNKAFASRGFFSTYERAYEEVKQILGAKLEERGLPNCWSSSFTASGKQYDYSIFTILVKE